MERISMEENILFNLGNQIATSKDEKELIRIAQYDSGKKPDEILPNKLPAGYLIIKFPENQQYSLLKLS